MADEARDGLALEQIGGVLDRPGERPVGALAQDQREVESSELPTRYGQLLEPASGERGLAVRGDVEADQNLEQRGVARRTLRVPGLDEPLERKLLVGLCGERGPLHPA